MPFNNGQLPSIKEILKNLIDELNRFLLVLLAILIIVAFFINSFIIDLSKFIVLIIIIFRLVSKNKIQRTKENKTFLKIIRTITKPFTNIYKSLKDNNVYKKCPKCKTILKLPLPNKRGINHAKCPNCSNRVTLFTLRKKKKEKIKVEVIKKKK